MEIETQRLPPRRWEGGVVVGTMDVILDRLFFHKNYILRQKRIDACERVRINMK
jgi:hypothetical protein